MKTALFGLALALVAGCDKSEGVAPSARSHADAGVTIDVATAQARFSTTVRPILLEHCASCHASTIKPFHASPSVDTAYQEIMTFHLVDFAMPKSSRLYTRLAVDNHHCWAGDCAASSETMLDALTAWASGGSPQGASQDRKEGASAVIAAELPQAVLSAAKLNDQATELTFMMAPSPQGPVVFSVRIERFDAYSYRLFWPSVRAPNGVNVAVKSLLFKVNDVLRTDGSFALLDKTVEGKGDLPVVLDATTTLILLTDKGAGTDRIAPSFTDFAVR